jgi:hypothetical protein
MAGALSLTSMAALRVARKWFDART